MTSSRSTTTEEWVLDMLAGFRFHPSEEEMVNLLRKKVQGKGPQACLIIPDLDVGYDPWDLPALMFPDSPYKAREWFSFSRPDYKYIDSPRCNRATKQGFWKITGKARVIKQLSKSVTCKKRTLTFYEGRVSNSKKTDWVKHEYFFSGTEPGSDLNQRTDIVLIRLKKKSDNKKELKAPGTGGYIASNSEDNQAAGNHMITEAEHLAYKELEHVLLGSGNHVDDEPGGCVSSEIDGQLVDDMIQELFAQEGEYLDSPVPPPEPPQLHQPPQLGSVPDVYDDEYSNWPSPIGDDDSYSTNKNISTNYDNVPVSNVAYKIQNQATDESISEVSPFHQFQLENYTLLSPILYSEPGDLLHANRYIGCNELQSLDMEIETLFPQSS